MANNAAFALGPAVGGFLATRSYDLAFYGAATGFVSYSLLLFFLARETLQTQTVAKISLRSIFAPLKPFYAPFARRVPPSMPSGLAGTKGYGYVFQDRDYMLFVALTSVGLIAPTMLWILMPVYAKTNYGLSEALYGWIPTTNALMCVFVQYAVTSVTRQHRTLPVLSIGMLIYALGAGSVALMSSFWGFWLSMVTLTFGELILVPTASKYVADLAPADMRGRYMSIYWLSWGLSRTLAPLIGGFLNDRIAPRAIWIGGLLFGLTSTCGLFLLSRLSAPQTTPLTEP